MDTNPNVVKQPEVPTTPPQVGNGNTGSGLPQAPTVTSTSEGNAPGAPGSKTPPELLLKSLQEEREKAARLEEELSKRGSNPSGEAFSDEGILLENKIKSLSSELEDIKFNNAKRELQESNPILKDKWNDFESFRLKPENKGMSISTAAKAYLIENGMFDQPRVGLESPTGGPRTPVSGGMTAEEIKNIRETDPRKYREMLEKGQIKV